MFRFAVTALACAALLALTLPAAAQDNIDQIYPSENAAGLEPGDVKAAYQHFGEPWPEDHRGNPVNNMNPIPWYWHVGDGPFAGANGYQNVAGIQFTLKYDPHEVAITSFDAKFGQYGLEPGHVHFDIPDPLPESQDLPNPISAMPARIVGTMWLPHVDAEESGINLPMSQNVHLFDLGYRPRHTSHYSDPQFNTEIDVRVSELRPIFHPQAQHQTSVWVERHYAGPTVTAQGPAGTVHVLQNSDNVRQHTNSVTGVFVPNSGLVLGMVPSSTDPNPAPWMHVSANILPSEWVWAPEPVDVHFVNSQWTVLYNPDHPIHISTTIPLSGAVFPYSVYVLGNAVGGPIGGTGAEHYGLGIDHVPEPVSLILLAMGGVALALQYYVRRRRRHEA